MCSSNKISTLSLTYECRKEEYNSIVKLVSLFIPGNVIFDFLNLNTHQKLAIRLLLDISIKERMILSWTDLTLLYICNLEIDEHKSGCKSAAILQMHPQSSKLEHLNLSHKHCFQ